MQPFNPPPSPHPLRKEQGAHQSRSGVILKLAYSFLLCEKCRLSLNFLFVLDLPPHNAFVVKKKKPKDFESFLTPVQLLCFEKCEE